MAYEIYPTLDGFLEAVGRLPPRSVIHAVRYQRDIRH